MTKLPETVFFEKINGKNGQRWDGLCYYETLGFRSPLKGEWYLSGAMVQAYRARQDLTSLYYIVRPTHRAVLQTCTIRGEEITL